MERGPDSRDEDVKHEMIGCFAFDVSCAADLAQISIRFSDAAGDPMGPQSWGS